jgi:glycosyltransferase involved in cell wall biosynthesis
MAPVKGWRIRRVVARARPDVVHGLRLPHEAMTALVACPPAVPLAVSIWGNDLTNEAPATRMGARAARRVLARADLLFADCQRDIDLAADWGLRSSAVTAVLPGGGGIDLARVAQGDRDRAGSPGVLAGDDCRLVVNARGVRAYVHNETLLAALSLLAAELDPLVRIVFVDSAHDVWLRRAVASHRLRDRMVVTGKRSPGEVLALFSRAEVSVSITSRDGTPNTLLEAMASGAVPVCGDLPSIREWIEPGRNGFLAAFDDPPAVADALRCALRLPGAERSAIGAENRRIVGVRAERGAVGRQAAEKYGLLAMRHEERLAPAGEP